jgi:hypothetical protein
LSEDLGLKALQYCDVRVGGSTPQLDTISPDWLQDNLIDEYVNCYRTFLYTSVFSSRFRDIVIGIGTGRLRGRILCR